MTDPWNPQTQPAAHPVEDQPAYAPASPQAFTEAPPQARPTAHVPSAAIGLGALALMLGIGVVGLDNAVPHDYGHGYVVQETVSTMSQSPTTSTSMVRHDDTEPGYIAGCHVNLRRANPTADYGSIVEWCDVHSEYSVPTIVTTEVLAPTTGVRDHQEYTKPKSRVPVYAAQGALGIGAILALAGAIGAYTRRPEPAHTTSTRSGGMAGGLLGSVGALRDAYAQQRAGRDVPPTADYPEAPVAPASAPPSEFAGAPAPDVAETPPTTPAAAPSDDGWGF